MCLRSLRLDSSGVLQLLSSELKVTVETTMGQNLQLTVHPGRAKVSDVMEEIKRHTDVPVEEQKLYHGESCISNRPWRALPEALLFVEDPTLLVEVPEYFEISVRVAEDKVIPVKIDKTKTLRDLQQKVLSCAPLGRRRRVWFIYEGNRLNPDEENGSLESVGITSGSVVDVEFEVILISVKVQLPNEDFLQIEVNPNGTVGDLLQKVTTAVDVELGENVFVLDGTNLDLQDTSASLQGKLFRATAFV